MEAGHATEVVVEEERSLEKVSVAHDINPVDKFPITQSPGSLEKSSGSESLTSPSTLVSHEQKARRDLEKFLENRKVDPRAADEFQVHINLTKKRKSEGKDGKEGKDGQNTHYTSVSATFTGPDGSILTSKIDVYNAIVQTKRPAARQTAEVDARLAAHESARSRLTEIEDCLPIVIDGIKVLKFGKFQDHPNLVSPVQVWPMGYLAEVTVPGETTSKGTGTSQCLRCEVSSINGLPEFSITVASSSQTFVALSEATAWKKVGDSAALAGTFLRHRSD